MGMRQIKIQDNCNVILLSDRKTLPRHVQTTMKISRQGLNRIADIVATCCPMRAMIPFLTSLNLAEAFLHLFECTHFGVRNTYFKVQEHAK